MILGMIHFSMGIHDVKPEKTKKDFAACIVGAPRTMGEKKVYPTKANTLLKSYEPHQYDIFYYLTVGVEVSIKGSGKSYKGAEAELAPALADATAVQLQYNETPGLCHSVTAGRFPKMGRCAEMVSNYSTIHNIEYEVFFIFRPDQVFRGDFLPNYAHISTMPKKKWFSVWCAGDCYAMDARGGLPVITNVGRDMECCNIKTRQPSPCFVRGRFLPNGTWLEPSKPEPNFMMERYLRKHMPHKLDWIERSHVIGGGDAYIERPPSFTSNTKGLSLAELHDMQNSKVRQHKHAELSHVVMWKEIAEERRTAVLGELLAKAG